MRFAVSRMMYTPGCEGHSRMRSRILSRFGVTVIVWSDDNASYVGAEPRQSILRRDTTGRHRSKGTSPAGGSIARNVTGEGKRVPVDSVGKLPPDAAFSGSR